MKPAKKRGELIFSVSIHDCEVQTFRAGGKGGQNQNKRESGVRVIHHPSGARGESREERSQLQNKRTAFIRMTQTGTFKAWLYWTVNNLKTPEERVAEDMRPENLLVETRETGTWAPAPEVLSD
jgi:hypothetical protein